MRSSTYILRSYVIPAAAVALTSAVELALGHATGIFQPRFFFIFPVLLCAWFSGERAGIITTVISAVIIEYWFKPPFFALDWDLLQTAIFILDGVLISIFVSAKCRAEERLRQLNDELESRVSERTEELERISRSMREREVLAALGTTVAKIAHQIANPVNAISTTVQFLEQGFRTPEATTKDEALEGLQTIAEETTRLEKLIWELREISRPLKVKTSPVKLPDLIAEAVAAVQLVKDKHKQIRVEQDFPGELPPLMADRAKFHEALVNLLNNAFEAMPEGGTLSVTGHMVNNRITIEIRDTGVGIPKDMKAFDLFVTSKPCGWGLGLAIVRQIILAQEGTIDYESEEGKGTTLRICLPASPQ